MNSALDERAARDITDMRRLIVLLTESRDELDQILQRQRVRITNEKAAI